jgi:four helix bundle protein
VNYKEWETAMPEAIAADALWRAQAYRLALFACDIGWEDVGRLAQDRRTQALSDQLYRSLGSISANIAEGYSRGTGKDRAHFYEYALGSARESRDWYYKARHVLNQDVVEHRLSLQTQIIRLLLTMVPNQRKRTIREDNTLYEVDP